MCVCVCVHESESLDAVVCVWLLVQERAAGVTAPLLKVTSKESRANYYADQSWWRLRGLLRCNHISWPERNLQPDPNHKGYSAEVSRDGGLEPMFSFHKTLFPYLKPARDYQAKQVFPTTPALQQAWTCICMSFRGIHMQCNTYSIKRPQGHFLVHKHSPESLTVDHSCPQTCIHSLPAVSFLSTAPLFSPTRLSGERLCLICGGLGGQIAIYSIPVGEVCVSRL